VRLVSGAEGNAVSSRSFVLTTPASGHMAHIPPDHEFEPEPGEITNCCTTVRSIGTVHGATVYSARTVNEPPALGYAMQRVDLTRAMTEFPVVHVGCANDETFDAVADDTQYLTEKCVLAKAMDESEVIC